jgi:RNA polymerase sigma-70 factor (ECF subfamily)
VQEAPKTRPSLIVRVRDHRDERAWAEFVEIYEPVVYRFARRRGIQDADARELAQNVFVAVASAIERWEPDEARGHFRGWLFTIARNLLVNLVTSRQRHPQGTGDTQTMALLQELPEPTSEDSQLFDEERKRELLHRAAERIRGEFRDATWQAFWRTTVGGEPIPDVAEALRISVGAVYIARSRVMARLRRTVEQLEG